VRILDCSAGHRAIWFNRLHPEAVYVDIREETSPSVVADTKALPFREGVFEMVVWDPPHVVNGPESRMAEYYGAQRAEDIRRMIKGTAVELYRVTTENAVLALKWNDHDVRLERILKLMEGWSPLFGHRVASRMKHRSSTYWVMLKKRAPGYSSKQLAFKMLGQGTGFESAKPDW